MTEQTGEIIILHPAEDRKEPIRVPATVPPTLQDLQEWVGGCIEAVPCGTFEGKPAQMFAHDEAKLRGKQANAMASALAWKGGLYMGDYIAGTAVVVTGKAMDRG